MTAVPVTDTARIVERAISEWDAVTGDHDRAEIIARGDALRSALEAAETRLRQTEEALRRIGAMADDGYEQAVRMKEVARAALEGTRR